MEKLTSLDAAFLYLETQRTPMHVGSVYLFEKGDNQENFDLEAFKQFLQSRLHLTNVFRRRIVEVPLQMSTPYWIEDGDFNLDFHLLHLSLPKPGNLSALMDLAGRVFSRPLDRDRPLWEMIVVEGLDNVEGLAPGSFALISKVHHAAIDGMSGAKIMASVFDVSPEPREVRPPKKAWKGESVPSPLNLFRKATGNMVASPFKLAGMLSKAAVNTASTVIEAARKKVPMPPRIFSAPKTLLNVPVSPNRIFAGSEIELKRVKGVKNLVEGTTVNDVILTICSGALKKYIEEKEGPLNKSMVAMAPISVRSADEEAGGNKISAMLVSLATNEPDPLARLRLIHESSRSSKTYSKAVGAEELMEMVPSQLSSLASRLYTTLGVSELHAPFYNLVITNVPGPPVPLYLNGAKLIKTYGMAPLFDGMGLLITVFSYAGKIYFGCISCRNIMPDIDNFARYIVDELGVLEERLSKEPSIMA